MLLVAEEEEKEVRDLLFELEARIVVVRSEGAARVPKRDVAFERSESLTFWKSRKRIEGQRDIIQYL